MFQYVAPSISSDVILFHRRRESVRQKNGKVKGKSMAKALYPIGGREREHTKGKPNKKKQTGKRNGRNGWNGTKPTRRKLYYAELGASCL